MNFVSRLKRMEVLYLNIARMIEEEINNFEKKIENFDSKLFRFEDKLMMLKCNIKDKTDAVHEEVKKKMTSDKLLHDQDLVNLKQNLEVQIKDLEEQLVVKENEIVKLEHKISEKTQAIHEKVEEFQSKESQRNNEAMVDCKDEHYQVINKLNILEGKIVNLNNKSTNTRCKETRKQKSQAKCAQCNEVFDSRTDMEIHIQNSHEKQNYNCEKCDQMFVSEWRLKLHSKTHTKKQKARNCHYFNSGKTCPFQKLGCKFEHTESISCKFGDKCRFIMCQFKHF